MLGLALSTADIAESVQTELIDGGGYEYDIKLNINGVRFMGNKYR